MFNAPLRPMTLRPVFAGRRGGWPRCEVPDNNLKVGGDRSLVSNVEILLRR